MNCEDEPPKKKKKTNPSPPSFFSLPDVIIVNCLARISRSYYPKLSLVCKTFRSLFLSSKLSRTTTRFHLKRQEKPFRLSTARYHLKTRENFFHVCLRLPNHRHPSWFTLWIKPDQTLTNDLDNIYKKSTGNTRLVQIPSSYYHSVPSFVFTVGSERYSVRRCHPPSHDILRNAPRMTVAREAPIACVLNGKIYVMGGCKADKSTNWAEVFYPKTQTWESLPDPGAELRSYSIKNIKVSNGKLYVRTNGKKDYCYDPEEGRWYVVEKQKMMCTIENVWYHCGSQSFLWYDAERKEWRVVRGLSALHIHCRFRMIEIVNYRGKLLILWDRFAQPRRRRKKKIWCAVIALERRNNDEVWGNIEWANSVLTVPSSYVFFRSRRTRV